MSLINELKHDIPLFGIQSNPEQHSWTTSPKAYGQLIIDDTCLGIPLKMTGKSNRPYVNWYGVRKFLIKECIL